MRSETDFPPDLRALESNYELIRELGQGGMAAVYLARHRETGRLVAIKAIRGRYLDDPDALQRFAREARTVADLSHPNIARTEAIEQIDDRAVAIIMEYIAGGTVRDRLREFGAFSAEDTESVLRDVANALGYAHKRGIVHRDVKPENVFLEKPTGRALLSDFGIARRIEGDSAITLLGASLGTPQYMSPEQIDGANVDGRSDIYSLGVLGWELLTGRRPWAGESLYGVIYRQKHEELPRITSLRPRVPANLLFAIEGALVKDRARRWQTTDEFLEQLTYAPPPVLTQHQPAPEEPVGTEPTVKFRRPVAEPQIAPNEPAVARRPETERIPPPQSAFGRQRATRARRDGLVRRRLVFGSALLVPLAIAVGSWYVLFFRSRARGAVPADSTEVTSSAGAVALDAKRPADSIANRDSARRPAVPASKAPAPTVPPSPSADSPVAAGASSGAATRVSRRDSAGDATISERCRRAAMADQRACTLAYIAVNDVSLQSAYDSLIIELRRSAHVGRRAPDPPAVRQLRVEQRTWLADRDRDCTRETRPGSVTFWARPLAECFARLAAPREAELRGALDRARQASR